MCAVPAPVAAPAASSKAGTALIVVATYVLPSRGHTVGLQDSWHAGTVASSTAVVFSPFGIKCLTLDISLLQLFSD